jgi:arylsulfatase A-like enzyme
VAGVTSDLGRTFAARVVLGGACLLCGSTIGLLFGLWKAFGVVSAQGYAALGFTRSVYLTIREQAFAGAGVGALLGAAAGAIVIASALLAIPFPQLRVTRETVARALRSPAALAWAIAATSLASTAALYFVAREGQVPLGVRNVAYALGFTIACGLALAAIALAARRSDRVPGPALVAGLAAAAAPAFWFNRSIVSSPPDREYWLLNAVAVLLGVAVFWWTRRPRRPGPLLVALATALALALGGIAAAGRFFGAPSLQAARPWNVVLIGIDTLRADATSLYGPSLHGRDTTPNLRKLAERGLLFDSAVSQAPWTMPAFASMLTGKYPHEHGAYSLSGTLPMREVTLAEVLREAGYATHGVVSNMYVSSQRAFDQGFESFDDSNTFDNFAVTSAAITDLSIRALERDDRKPFFLFAHYFDPHFEYVDDLEVPWAEQYRGWLRGELDFAEDLLRMRHLVESPDVDWLVDLYEEEIAHTDREIGRLIEWIDRQGLAHDTLILVTADHGEEFVDHESFGHTQTLFEEQLRVPLIVVVPGGESRRAETVVETRAIFGTVLDALQLDFAAEAREHTLLAPRGADDGVAFSTLWLSKEVPRPGMRRFRSSSLREGRWKLIRDYTRDRVHLFDLEADPREHEDLADRRPEIRDRMRSTLEAWTQEQQNRSGEAPPAALDPDEVERLRALGYL